MEDESLSSVEQFLRENGFSISDTALELASLSDDDLMDDELLLSDAEDRQTPNDRSTSSTSEPPRFVLLDDESLLMEEKEEENRSTGDRTSERLEEHVEVASTRQDQYQDSLDRSMLFGGSDLSLSSGAPRPDDKDQDVLSSPPSSTSSSSQLRMLPSIIEPDSTPLSPRYQTTPQQKENENHMTMVSAASSESSSQSISPSLRLDSSGQARDVELNDALGVHRFPEEQRMLSKISNYGVSQRNRDAGGWDRTLQQSQTFRRSETQRVLFTDDRIRLKHFSKDPIHDKTSARLAQFYGLAESKLSESQYEENISICDVSEEKKHANDDPSTRYASSNDRQNSKQKDSSVIGNGAWNGLNDLLRRNGLPRVRFRHFQSEILPDRDSLFAVIHDFAVELERKNETIQDLVLASQRNSRVQNRQEEEIKTLEKQKEEERKKLEKAKAEIQRLKTLQEKQRKSAELLTKNLKISCLRLRQQLKVSEHRVKAKEILVERLQTKLKQQVDKETFNKTRIRQAFRDLQGRDPQRANPRDIKALEAISVYEAQREQMQEEIDCLKSDVAALNSELRDKDNFIARQTRESLKTEPPLWEQCSDESSVGRLSETEHRNNGHGSSSFVSDKVLVEQLEAARREQENAATNLRHHEATMIKKVARLEQELLAARETIRELKEENANLALEAESRPSIREYRLNQRRIQQLERQVAENHLALEEAKDLNELRKYMGTKELVERDRLNHRLHLNRLNTLPRETTLEVVKQVCRILHLTDISLIAPSLIKLCSVVSAVPRMEKFIRDVCGLVFLASKENTESTNISGASFELEQVLPMLQNWTMERKKMHALEEFKTSIVSELCKRDVEPAALRDNEASSCDENVACHAMTLSRAVEIVRGLVQLEKSVADHQQIYTNAAAELERHPTLLTNQIVKYFQHLFQIKSIEGVFPKINEIYLQIKEIQNFLHAIRDILHLKNESSFVCYLNAIKKQLLQKNETCFDNTNEKRVLKDQRPNFVVEKHECQPSACDEKEKNDFVGVRQVRRMSILIRELKRELGAATMDDILPRTKRLMELLSLSIHNTD
ncbi:hypothetical protein PsorP6_001076 [Peronosclerospora sorghi]|uniref:Uncharacterized protein n=1 Tax=Peronosclerospora sorghi TaxID=230839 RepID=A0ACC0WZI4_9STRA|nr:hypothetical protein PsorP6_001076 [Peronosclerospora sorghi]